MLRFSAFLLLVMVGCVLKGQQFESSSKYKLETNKGLTLYNVKAEPILKKDKQGISVVRAHKYVQDETLVIIPNELFQNGTIELELSGEPLLEADPNMRGFVGLAFRIDPEDFNSYECFYLRPTNGRASEQIRRNHSSQYISHPEYPWYRLRKESPGSYESYVDLVPGEWTKVKIEVEGTSAKLYVHDATQPCLVVHDLKKGDGEGLVGLWLHATTMACFRDLTITFKK